MSGCYLRISGRDFDGPAQAAALGLPIDGSWRRGDPRSETKAHRSGGLRLRVSGQDGGNVPGQIENALTFLSRHQDKLTLLMARPDVETALLDFSWDVPTNGTVTWNRWPPALCKLCGELGVAIEATVYVTDPR